jgi:hypothetical protein
MTKKVFYIDGEKVTIKNDTSNDSSNSNNNVAFDNGIQQIQEQTELGQVLENLNEDILDSKTRTSGIDLKSRLHPFEISGILAVDSLVTFGFLPLETLAFTRQKKRLAVSLMGKGREEIVKIVQGRRDEEDVSGGFGSGLKNMFGKKE